MQRDRTQVECIVLVTSGFHDQTDRKGGPALLQVTIHVCIFDEGRYV